MKPISVRAYCPEDADALANIFFRGVRESAAAYYSDEQRLAWCPELPVGDAWSERLSNAETFVAEYKRAPVGFMSLVVETGYLDFAYVVPEAMGLGVADVLYSVLERRAREMKLKRLTSDASELARPFFLRHGWREIARLVIVRRNVMLHNYRMEKILTKISTR